MMENQDMSETGTLGHSRRGRHVDYLRTAGGGGKTLNDAHSGREWTKTSEHSELE